MTPDPGAESGVTTIQNGVQAHEARASQVDALHQLPPPPDDFLEHYWAPASRQPETLQQRFDRLSRQWKQETRFLSSVSQMSMHPAYQQIIGIGPRALPLLLRELQQNPNHWFWALYAISGVDPVPQTDRGNVEAMRKAWLRWGEEQELLR
jgi:hypothetical protein